MSFFCALLLTGCSYKLFPTAHVYNEKNMSNNKLYYFYDYTQTDPAEKLKVNEGLFIARGLKAMSEMDSILKRNIKSFGFDTLVRLEHRDRIVVDSIWNRLECNLNDSAFQLVNKLSDKVRGKSTILKIRVNVRISSGPTSGFGLGFYGGGSVYGSYLGILFQIYEGEIHSFKSLRSVHSFFHKTPMFYPKRSRKFLDKILIN